METVDKYTRSNLNRQAFAAEMAARTSSGQRAGLFSLPQPLTVGDASTNYQCERRPKESIGKQRNFSVYRGKTVTTDTFGKLETNAVGDEFQDPGKYFLRTDAGKRSISSKCFKPNGGHKLVRHSEFLHMKEFADRNPGPRNMPVNFMARSTYEPFQKQFQYTEDAYERKEDMRKLDYQRRAALILDKGQPYTTSVYQHGCFDPHRKTYGSDGNFPFKPKYKVDDPKYGAFRIGNLPKQGYNKTIGSNHAYIEDPIEDTVTYQKDVAKPIWRDPTHVKSTPINPMMSTYKNTMGQHMK